MMKNSEEGIWLSWWEHALQQWSSHSEISKHLFFFWKYVHWKQVCRRKELACGPEGMCAASPVFGKGRHGGSRALSMMSILVRPSWMWQVSELWTVPKGVSHSPGKGRWKFQIKQFWLLPCCFSFKCVSESFRCHINPLLFLLSLPCRSLCCIPLLLFHASGFCCT